MLPCFTPVIFVYIIVFYLDYFLKNVVLRTEFECRDE